MHGSRPTPSPYSGMADRVKDAFILRMSHRPASLPWAGVWPVLRCPFVLCAFYSRGGATLRPACGQATCWLRGFTATARVSCCTRGASLESTLTPGLRIEDRGNPTLHQAVLPGFTAAACMARGRVVCSASRSGIALSVLLLQRSPHGHLWKVLTAAGRWARRQPWNFDCRLRAACWC